MVTIFGIVFLYIFLNKILMLVKLWSHHSQTRKDFFLEIVFTICIRKQNVYLLETNLELLEFRGRYAPLILAPAECFALEPCT